MKITAKKIVYALCTMATLIFSTQQNALGTPPSISHDRTFSSATIQVLPKVSFKQAVTGADASHILITHPPQDGLTTTHYVLRALALTGLRDVRYERCGVQCADDVYPNAPTPGYQGGWPTALDELKADPHYFKQFNYISGHNLKIGMDLPALANLPNAKYVTLIRNPLGAEGHILATANFALQQNYITRDQYASYIKTFIDNPYTRMLAGDDLIGECTEETFQRAISNLQEKFLLVGVTEEADLFLATLAAMRGWPNLAVARFHVTGPEYKVYKTDADIPADLREYIKKQNQFDLRLYEFAKKHWQEWKQKHIAAAYSPGQDEDVLCLPPEYPLERVVYELKVSDVAEYNLLVKNTGQPVETQQIWPAKSQVSFKLPAPKY